MKTELLGLVAALAFVSRLGRLQMKREVLSGLVLLSLLGASPVRADSTTYNYVGNPYTNVSGAYDSSLVGTHMTGSVTFNFDTSGFSGAIYVYDPRVIDLSFTAGTITDSFSQPLRTRASSSIQSFFQFRST